LLSILGALRAAILYATFSLVIATIFWFLALSVAEPGPAFDWPWRQRRSRGPDLAGRLRHARLVLGIGVREAVLIAALEGGLGIPASGLIALALRLVTIAGDVVFFILGMMLGLADDRPKSVVLGEEPVWPGKVHGIINPFASA
jgi:hypothetical protein